MSSFQVSLAVAILTLTILITGILLALVSLFLARHIQSRARQILVVFLAVIHLTAVAYILAKTTLAVVTENFTITHSYK